MKLAYGVGHTEPVQLVTQDAGKITVQVFEGPGLWIGRDRQSLRNGDPVGTSNFVLRDGFNITRDMGVVELEWNGPLWAYNPDAESSPTLAVLEAWGCRD